MRKIVDVFVRDDLKASYPVVIDPNGRAPTEADFVNYVRRRLNRSVYSSDDIKAAKFVVREAGGDKAVRKPSLLRHR